MKIKKGDNVTVISGNDKGKTGTVLGVFPGRDSVRVQGLNMKKKHMRPRAQGQKGEIVHVPGLIRASRVMPICAKCGKHVRPAYAVDNAGKKQRVCRKCRAAI